MYNSTPACYGSQMKRETAPVRTLLALCLLLPGCSGLDALTERGLADAERRWAAHRPDTYRMVIEISGQRVESGRYEVFVVDGAVGRMTLDGFEVAPDRSDDYSIHGLFRTLRQELALSEDPRQLGAPAGYTAYLMARFHPESGRLEHYRRTVGGASNNVDIEVVEFEADAAAPPPTP